MVFAVKVLSDLIVVTLLKLQTQHHLEMEQPQVLILVRIQTKYITQSL